MPPAEEAHLKSPFPDGELEEAAEIGAVDSQGVRVWVRQPGAATANAQLWVRERPPIASATTLSPDEDWTGAIDLRLPAPAPDEPFVCTVGERRLGGRLAPRPGAHTSLVFGFGSCHRPYELNGEGRIVPNEAAGIYPAMVRDLRRADARFVILGGDQVYSDELAPISIRENLSGDEDHPPPFDEALAAYRRVSRGFLGQVGLRRVREAFPTYVIWDDHDIFNNWGSRLEKTPLDQRLFEAASRAYGEYQHQRNPGGTIGPPPYHYTFAYGDIGFMVLDVRGARDYEQGRLLGEEQMTAIQAYLTGEAAREIQTLFIVASIPIAHVSRWMAKLFDRLPGSGANAVRDRWCSAAFVSARDQLLAALFRWQTAEPARQVILLGGDVHAASAFTIRQRRGRGVIQQFTSSAFSTPHSKRDALLTQLAVRAPNLFESRWRFQRRLLAFANNFGIVRLKPLPRGGHRVEFQVRAWHPRSRTLRTAGRIVSTPVR